MTSNGPELVDLCTETCSRSIGAAELVQGRPALLQKCLWRRLLDSHVYSSSRTTLMHVSSTFEDQRGAPALCIRVPQYGVTLYHKEREV